VKFISAPRALGSPKAKFWLRTVLLISLAACMFALGIAALGTSAGSAPASTAASPADSPKTSQKTYEGMVTDTRCGAKHSAAIGKTASDCTRICVHSGEQFALVDGETVYSLQGELLTLKKLAGQRVKIEGTLEGNRLSVISVVPSI
jgi:hypothetical protein